MYYKWNMELLTGEFQKYIICGNKKITLETDFRRVIEVVGMIEKGEDKNRSFLRLLVDKNIIADDEMIEKIADFIGRDFLEYNKNGFSFYGDFPLIYGGFLQAYNIDLAESKIHWHKFVVLFMSLPENTSFVQLMTMRNISPQNPENRIYQRRAVLKCENREA